MQTGAIKGAADFGVIRLISKLEVHKRAATEINTQRNLVPEEHGEDAGHAEDQREAEEVPLLAQKIDICITKKFHVINL
jgi:hypothetical protein